MNTRHWLTIREVSALLDRREISAAELLKWTFERIDSTEPDVHAYVRVMHSSARAEADRADRERSRGWRRGPLHGVPIAVKDVCYTRGFPTEAGSQVLAGFVPDEDAVVVHRIRRAGAVLVGKTVTHEFAYGQDTPATRNAWDRTCYPGGSSAGSAVSVAVGSAYGAIGTDTGGSVRIPAAMNGVVGLKPTHGRVSRRGVVPMSSSLDTVGPLARTVEDCALMLQAMAGGSRDDPTTIDEHVPDYSQGLSGDLAGFVIGVERDYFFDGSVSSDVREAVEACISQLASLGARIVEVKVDHLQYAASAGMSVLLADTAEWHHRLLRERGTRYGSGTRVMLELGELVLASSYVRAQKVRRLIQSAIRHTFEEHRLDAIAAPTTPTTTVPVEAVAGDHAGDPNSTLSSFFHHSVIANVVGLPALSLPCGFCVAGLPIGIQLLGRPFGEDTLFRIGHRYQSCTHWHKSHPDIRE